MSRYHLFCTPRSGKNAQAATRRGMTLVEILISVALTTIIMLAAIRVLSYVSAELNRAQGAMVLGGRARTAQLQIERDLACITAPLTPPLRFDDAQGYAYISEGLGGHYGNLFHDNKIGWGVEDIAVNSETGAFDSTIGDCDDILMFTARAPGDTMFRGLVGGKIVESKEAEICYFLRGTTLYRRVLLIIPDEQLQMALRLPDYSTGAFPACAGYGFYRDFDVSARLEWNTDVGDWRVKANTLADLTRRENRFGHALNNENVTVANPLPFPYGIHNNAAWYQLRLPTLAECTMDDSQSPVSWRMGTQIVTTTNRYDRLISQLLYEDGSQVDVFPTAVATPYIDYWNNPLPWNQNNALSPATQSLTVGSGIYDSASTSTFQFKQRTNEDVLLTNVISFDIQVWDAESKKFIGLGEDRINFTTNNTADARENSKSLSSQGFFGTNDGTTCFANSGTIQYGLLPCVYDTWTDAYENDATGNVLGANSQSIFGLGRADGIIDIMEHVDQWRCPPPYNAPLTGIQIKIRVFDSDTNNIREVTIRRNFN